MLGALLLGCAHSSNDHTLLTPSDLSQVSIVDDRFFCVARQSRNEATKRLICVDKRRPLAEQQMTIEQADLQNHLSRLGVRIIQQGSKLQMMVPTDVFFIPGTARIRGERKQALSEIGLYLKNYTQLHYPVRYPIKVYGYSDRINPPNRSKVISYRYAQAIAASLWDWGFSASQLRVAGYGAQSPIASFRTPDGNAWNRRVMIQVN